ncbi:hypothetical protein ACIOWI_01460 [Streptomyces sp. NPDC087659]|uniref:hypothetical protein n=1 Tax=Streptomyces sp. NPDC087659 TaxID=3365801 RepID=UPI003817E0BB
MATPAPQLELAHYYPDWIWQARSLDWMKSLLLYFDGLAIVLPTNLFEVAVEADPILAQPLLEKGMLHNFPPREWLTSERAAAVRQAANAVAARSGPTAGLGVQAATLSTFHFVAHGEDADRIIGQMLESRVIGASYPASALIQLQPAVRLVMLFAVALAAQASLTTHRIHLVGDHDTEINGRGIFRVLGASGASVHTLGTDESGRSMRRLPSKALSLGDVLSRDIQNVGVDLSGVPLDEVLDYRRRHGDTYRAYARGLRGFVASLGAVDAADQEQRLRDRAEEIADQAAALRRARLDWGRPVAALTLSGMSAAWTLSQTDLWGAVLAGLAAAAGFAAPTRKTSAFTYLFERS